YRPPRHLPSFPTRRSSDLAWRQSGVPAELKAAYPEANAPGNWQNTPIMVDGLLYMSSGVGTVVALDPATGKVVWFDVPPHDEGRSEEHTSELQSQSNLVCR